ncbi:DUF945 family protein [Halomonas sp. YLGW01]|uniref:DUF945 family protein n=1 Tax=Halomonas sp. YLGW01 TaxID=2773308 RepID=UPI001781F946|nr:DUF945 family protein [Halomonas sp. YLGW01]
MRKGLMAAMAVALLGGGYLAAQAYSSERFEAELTDGLEAIEARGEVMVERRTSERGWFTSQGELVISPRLDDGWTLHLPYTARHGLASTRLSGELELLLDEQGQRLFAERLEAAPPRWSAEFETLSGAVAGRLDLAAFEAEHAGARLSMRGGHLTLDGEPGDLRLAGELAPWEVLHGKERLRVGRLSITARYRQDEAGRQRDQQGRLALDRLMLARKASPAIELEALSYQGDLTLGAEELQLGGTLALGEARLGGEPLLSGELDFSLARIDAEAVRALEAALDAEAARGHSVDAALDARNDAELAALLERLQPKLLALLADSPRLTLHRLALTSEMFAMDTRLSGELTFEGAGAESLSIARLDRPNQQRHWLNRLDGRFDWQGVPPLVLMQLGLPMTTERLAIVVEKGRPSINGRPLLPLL